MQIAYSVGCLGLEERGTVEVLLVKSRSVLKQQLVPSALLIKFLFRSSSRTNFLWVNEVCCGQVDRDTCYLIQVVHGVL